MSYITFGALGEEGDGVECVERWRFNSLYDACVPSLDEFLWFLDIVLDIRLCRLHEARDLALRCHTFKLGLLCLTLLLQNFNVVGVQDRKCVLGIY